MLNECYVLASSMLRDAVHRFSVISRTVGLVLHEIFIDELGFLEKLGSIAKIHNKVVFLALPLGFRTLFYMILLLIVKPRKLVIIVSPLGRFVENKVVARITRYFFNLFLTPYRLLRIDVMLIYPTPFEKNLLPPIAKGIEWVFIPIIEPYKFSKEMLVSSTDYSSIAVFTSDSRDLVKILEFYKLTEQLWSGFKILIVSDQGSLGFCLHLPSVICIETDGYEELLSRINIIALITPTITSNNILYMCANNFKLVLADYRVGLSYYMRSNGYVNIVVMEDWDPEKFFDAVATLVNQIDSIKKSILTLRPLEIRYDYGLNYLKYFITH
uniref:Glycosyltransferase family 1 protein n=1 Tax=Staphylothermus marinus TaxID=2280 RepID=A0A7C4JL32_STAMA